MVSRLRAVVVTDAHTSDIRSCVYPFVRSIVDGLATCEHVRAADDYYQALERIADIEGGYDVIIVLLRARCIFRHPGLFADVGKPVVVVDHDACQNSLPWHPNYKLWTRYYSENPVAALCVSGNQALWDLTGRIPGIVKRIAKGAPERFLSSEMNKAGRYCVFGTVRLDAYVERRNVFDEIRGHTIYDRVVRRWSLYRSSYYLSRIWRKKPDVSRIDFSYDRMSDVLRYYSAAIICDKGLREPMMKHFEVAALGLVPLRDDECMEELEEHGFRDGQSMLLYSDTDELKDKLHFYSRHIRLLNRIQEGARSVAYRHTWEKRAQELIEFVVCQLT